MDLALNLAENIVCIKRNTAETCCLKYHITYLGGDETNWASCFSPARNFKGTLISVVLYHIDIKFDYLHAHVISIIVIKTDSYLRVCYVHIYTLVCSMLEFTCLTRRVLRLHLVPSLRGRDPTFLQLTLR